MSLYATRLNELLDQCKEDKPLSLEDREFVHNAYWNGNALDITSVLDILWWSPDPLDVAILLDAASPTSPWIFRCAAAQAFGCHEEVGRKALQLMLSRDTHYVVRFYAMRELIDLEDESQLPFLDASIPSSSTPYKRALWIYGNFERESISKEEAEAYLSRTPNDPKHRYDWLTDHIGKH